MSKAAQKFYGLNGKEVTKSDIEKAHLACIREGLTEFADRLASALAQIQEGETVILKIAAPDYGLSGAWHNPDSIEYEALDDCGRLRKGFKYIKGGKIVKVKIKTPEIKPEKLSKPKVIQLKPTPDPKKAIDNTNRKMAEDLGGHNPLDEFKSDIQLYIDFSKIVQGQAVIPFKEATILWHEGKQVYENDTSYSFAELQKKLIEIYKAQEDRPPFSGYDKVKIRFFWSDETEYETRFDMALDDFNPLNVPVSYELTRDVFGHVLYLLSDQVKISGENVEKSAEQLYEKAMLLSRLQLDDQYDKFNEIVFYNEAMVAAMRKQQIKFPRMLLYTRAVSEGENNINQWVEITKEYAAELGRDEAVAYFYNSAEFEPYLKHEIKTKFDFDRLPQKTQVPAEIETKEFTVTFPEQELKKADRRKTTNLLKKYLKEVFGIAVKVRSESFSMGSSMHVSYQLGPSPAQIESVIDQLQYGKFNGMDDSYNYRSDFHGIFLDGYQLDTFKYTSVSRDIPEEFKVMIAEAISRDYNHSGLPKLKDIAGDSTKEKLSVYFDGPSDIRQYYDIVYRTVRHANFQTQDPAQVKDIKVKVDQDDMNLYWGIYFTYKIGNKKYDSRQYSTGKTTMAIPPKAFTRKIQIVNYSPKEFAVLGYLSELKDALVKIGGDYRQRIKVGGSTKSLNAVIFNKSKLTQVTDLLLDFENSKGLNAPSIDQEPAYIYRLLNLLNIDTAVKAKGLNAARHSGIAQQALDACGRLLPGFKFVKGGKIKKVSDPLAAFITLAKKELKTAVKDPGAGQYKLGQGFLPEFDYPGMLKKASEVKETWSDSDASKLIFSLQENNYGTLADMLQRAFPWKEPLPENNSTIPTENPAGPKLKNGQQVQSAKTWGAFKEGQVGVISQRKPRKGTDGTPIYRVMVGEKEHLVPSTHLKAYSPPAQKQPSPAKRTAPVKKTGAAAKTRSSAKNRVKDLATFLAGIKNNTLPILDYALVDPSGEIRATDLETEIVFSLQSLQTPPKSPVLISVAQLIPLLKTHTVLEIDSTGKVTTNKGEFALSASQDQVEDFPDKIELTGSKPVAKGIDSSLLNKFYTIAGKDDLRPVMSGVYFDSKDKHIVATDAHKLVAMPFDIKNSALLPRVKFGAYLTGDLSRGQSKRTDGSYGQYIRYSTPIATFTIREIDGNYPNYMAVIPKYTDQKTRWKVDKKQLDNFIKQGLSLADKKKALKSLTFKPETGNMAFIQADDFKNAPDAQKLMDRKLMQDIKNQDNLIYAVRPELLRDLIKMFEENTIEFAASLENRALLVNKIGLIMPVMAGDQIKGLAIPGPKRKSSRTTPSRSRNGKKKTNGLKAPHPETKEAGVKAGESSPSPSQVPNGIYKASDIAAMDFETLQFDQGYDQLMQRPAKNMRIALFGKPKNGKTGFAINFANYLTRFGPVLYNFSDQGIIANTKELLVESGLDKKPNAYITDTADLKELRNMIEQINPSYVIIDLINDYINQGLRPHEFKQEFFKAFPNTGFILVMETTKSGDFKGPQGWTHIVDAVFQARDFIIESRGRYGSGEMISWEKEAARINPERCQQIKEYYSDTAGEQGPGSDPSAAPNRVTIRL